MKAMAAMGRGLRDARRRRVWQPRLELQVTHHSDAGEPARSGPSTARAGPSTARAASPESVGLHID